MIRKIVIDGLITALLLLVLSLIINNVPFLGFLNMRLPLGIWPVVIVALVFGVINALLVPLVMRLFRRSRGLILYVATLVVDAAALMLTAWFAPRSLYIGGWLTAIIVAAILAAVGPLLFNREK